MNKVGDKLAANWFLQQRRPSTLCPPAHSWDPLRLRRALSKVNHQIVKPPRVHGSDTAKEPSAECMRVRGTECMVMACAQPVFSDDAHPTGSSMPLEHG